MLFNIEMMYDPSSDRIGIVEINPRMCGQFADLYQKVGGINGYEIALALAVGFPLPKRPRGPYVMAASFPLRTFGRKRVMQAPGKIDLQRAEDLYPGTHVWAECRTGEILGIEPDVEDGNSRRYAVINLGGSSPGELASRAGEIKRRLAFQLVPLQERSLPHARPASEIQR